MPPTAQQVHIDVGLTEVTQRVKNAAFIGEQVFPVVFVKKDSDRIWKYGNESMHNEDDSYTPGNDANEGDWSISHEQAYTLRPYRKKVKIIWDDRDNADDPIKYEEDAVTIEREKQLLQLERRVAAQVLDANNYDGNVKNVETPWTDVDSDPIADVDAAREMAFGKSLVEPNTLIIPRNLYHVLRVHPRLLEMYKYVAGGKLSLEQLKQIFEVERVLVGSAKVILNPQNPVMTNVWDSTKAALIYVPATPGLMQVSFGYVYRRKDYPFAEERVVKPELHCDLIYLNDKYDVRVQYKGAGALLTGVAA